MVARIVIAGESQCESFAKVSLVADHLAKHLPNFCYERIEKSVADWQQWLVRVNQKNNWHHIGSPLIWKELLLKGSRPYYIGGAAEFWEYCLSYYKFDVFMSEKIFADLENGVQYQRKLKAMVRAADGGKDEENSNSCFVVCISGAANECTPQVILGLMDLSRHSENKKISKIFLHDKDIHRDELKDIELDCSYTGSYFPNRLVKVIDRLGLALTECDLLIVMNHVPYQEDIDLEEWLLKNIFEMVSLTYSINASASSKLRIIFPNFGPSCFNATILSRSTTNIDKSNIVVSTSDLGLEALGPASEIAEVPLRNIYCPPVWGFVGINHLVDIRTTHHRYCAFEPYKRYLKVDKSTLKIGALTPELRTLEYLMHWDKKLWLRVAERKNYNKIDTPNVNKIVALLDSIKLWLFGCSPDDVVNLGLFCNGSYGLTLNGIFSQPARFVQDKWTPADSSFPKPRDPYVKINYLEKIAQKILDDIDVSSQFQPFFDLIL